jgi:type I restriction enzyme R subunit
VEPTGFNFNGYRVPFLYSTNGEVFWFQDVRHKLNRSRKVAGFHTPAALREMLSRDVESDSDWFASNPNRHPRLRPYQIDANTAIEEAIAKRKRQMLVAMATGTGKTFTLVNEVYRLLKSGAGKRILFLVDRRALAAQAVRAFASFEPEPNKKFDKLYEVYSQRFQKDDLDEDVKFDPKVLPKSYLENPQPKHAFVYVCTIQRMAINLFGRQAVWGGDEDVEDDAEQLTIPYHTTTTELSVELIEDVLKEKEAALAKEQAVIEDLKRVLNRMGYELVPITNGKARRTPAAGTAPTGRGRGRPRKSDTVTAPSGSSTGQ